jgi:type I restriction enzyme R subunit
MSHTWSEDAAVEQPAIALLRDLGWETANAYSEFDSGASTLGRDSMGEVVLLQRLRPALERLNPDATLEAIQLAIEELARDRSAMSLSAANREVYRLLKDGVKVAYRRAEDGAEVVETIRVIDWNDHGNNDLLLASQLWVAGDMYTRRADLVGFVNGLPWVFIELKAAHKALKTAFDDNLRDYKTTIPHLFWYNAFIVLSNGSESRIGSVSGEWEHFAEWKKINSEGETGVVSLETMLRGTCEPQRLFDLAENFLLYQETRGGLVKMLAKNHQYLGVNNIIRRMEGIKSRRGRLGVFWHTQGSGKSISMIFFAQKVLRKIPGNWTFLVVTDRQELDDQIYKNFLDAGVVAEKHTQATSGRHLKQLLGEDHRYIFTLIHKFHADPGTRYPKLSDRSDIVVITDEAHRTQYDALALNMRNALPNAAFIAFTGTPLIAAEEKTRQVFGDYVSVYNFKQSADDGATVPLYYENRIPQLQVTNQDLNEDMYQVLEEAALDEAQEQRLEREFAREYHLITRDDRLETIAADLVDHFLGRGFRGKAMVVSIDKATAVKMYDKVQKHWHIRLEQLREKRKTARALDVQELSEQIAYMEQTDMAVVVSQSQNEVQDLRKKGADIAPHRKRMLQEDLDEKFKDPKDPFRIVFVCAMWMTGFDVPCCSTIYLDKPMRNHTLMQTIARANRVFGEKVNGLIVDYVGVFRNLQRALAIYGTGPAGAAQPGEMPVQPKDELVKRLKEALDEVKTFCLQHGVDLDAMPSPEGFGAVKYMTDAVEALAQNEDTKARFLNLANQAARLFKAVLPDTKANEFAAPCALLDKLAEKVHSLTPQADISEVLAAVDDLLDRSVGPVPYVIRDRSGKYIVDLSQIDFEALAKRFAQGRKRIEADRLRAALQHEVNRMVQLNRTRMNYLETLQRMIKEYNAGSMNVDEFFRRLVEFAKGLSQEQQRAVAQELTEEELAVFDLLTRPDMSLAQKEERQVKEVAQELLETLKDQKLVLDWRKKQQARAGVRLCIEQVLDRLPKVYTVDKYRHKCEAVYQHIYESYFGVGKSVYAVGG